MTDTGALEPTVDVASVYAQQRAMLVRLAIMLVDDIATAEDVVQDAFGGLHRHQGGLRSSSATTAYLRKAVVNNAHSVLRRRRIARRYRWPEARAMDSAETEFGVAEEHRQVLAAVRKLPPRQRQVLVLRYWADMTEVQIAETLGISTGGVKSQASRAIVKVKAYMEAQS